jgi:hypothetical protein
LNGESGRRLMTGGWVVAWMREKGSFLFSGFLPIFQQTGLSGASIQP